MVRLKVFMLVLERRIKFSSNTFMVRLKGSPHLSGLSITSSFQHLHGAIESRDQKSRDKREPSSNTFMVRLKVSSLSKNCRASSSSNTFMVRLKALDFGRSLFYFWVPTPSWCDWKIAEVYVALLVLARSNTFMVRLKAYFPVPSRAFVIVFQHLHGAIESALLNTEHDGKKMFQHLHGAIERMKGYSLFTTKRSSNTFMVRLKVFGYAFCGCGESSSNTFMVRLKVSFCCWLYIFDFSFQHLHGAIESWYLWCLFWLLWGFQHLHGAIESFDVETPEIVVIEFQHLHGAIESKSFIESSGKCFRVPTPSWCDWKSVRVCLIGSLKGVPTPSWCDWKYI